MKHRHGPARVAALVLPLAIGCAPLGVLRPAGVIAAGRANEIGLASVAVSPRPWVEEPWMHTGQLWYTRQLRRRVSVSAIGAFDDEAAAVGGAMQLLAVRADRFAAGADVEVGWVWAAAGVPLAARPFANHWLYASPRIATYGIHVTPAIPAGLNVQIGQGASLRVEWQTSWAEWQAYNRRTHLGAGLAVQW